jgi:hypothetical protein
MMSASGQLSAEALLKGAVLNATGLQMPEQITVEQWVEVGRELGRFHRRVANIEPDPEQPAESFARVAVKMGRARWSLWFHVQAEP